jgi:tetratricopeptide (TPR) repeat protein
MPAFLCILLPLSVPVLLAAPGQRPPAASDLPRLETEKNVGLAALEEGNLEDAKTRFEAVRRLAPGEPLGWADGAVAAMRSKDLPTAARLLQEALSLSGNDGRVWALEGVRHELAQEASAIDAYERAVAANPKDLVSRWSAARLLAGKRPPDWPRALRALDAALAQAPANLFLLLRLCEFAREERNRASAVSAWERLSGVLEAESRADPKLSRFLAEAKAALDGGEAHEAELKSRIVENLLRATPRYQQARRDIEPGVVGLPLEEWSPALAARIRARAHPAPVSFVEKPLPGLAALRGLTGVRAFGRDGRDLVFAGSAGLAVALAREGYGAHAGLPGSETRRVEVADVANSGDFSFLTPAGLWLAGKQGYAKTPIPPGGRVLPVDYDSDGDLDLYVSAGGVESQESRVESFKSGAPSGDHLLRNNLDGTWTDVTAAALPPGLSSRAAVSADFDRDGDMDLVLALRDGGLVLLDNLRGGRFAEKEAGLPRTGDFRELATADLNADGRPDLVWTTGTATFVALNRGDGTFLPARELPAGGVPVLFDFDNDGYLDLFLASPSGSVLFRNDGSGNFLRFEGVFPPALDAEAVDIDGDGDLDLILVTAEGGALLLENRGGNANGWIDVTLEGLPTGSAKVNRFGYGSEVEVKAGELYAFRTVCKPVTHIGLGVARKADVLRIIWTNGIPQNALDPPVRTLVREVQQLKGSCPFVYAYDGTRWSFLTDALGASPVGLLYDGVHQAPADTREWLVVPGSVLRPEGGKLLLDLTEELWETAYLDLAELAAVDHPDGVEIVSDEKMLPPPFPAKRLFTVVRPRTPRALDEKGRDRTAEIAEEDGRYLGRFLPTRYQGIVAPHDLVLELPEARGAKTVMLYLTGWIFYADTSINVSLSQGKTERPFGPLLEVPDGRGGWRVAIPAMGYPAGKTKTMPVDLSEVLDRRDPRVRIRTNLEIYWDRIAYTVDEDRAPLRLTGVPLSSAQLSFRGFSRMTREAPDAPHVFLHDDVDASPRWADMAGLYTRLGDVRELLLSADDRYVVMKGGDAVRLEFDATGLPALPPGWSRDWLLVLDGWEKDADKNTVAGQTVEPLPFHGEDDARYGEPQAFPDDEAHRRFREEYLTRRGGPEEFLDALRCAGDRR